MTLTPGASCPRGDVRMEITMQVGLRALGWGLPRLAIAVIGTAFAIMMGYSMLVFGIVVVQAVASFSQ